MLIKNCIILLKLSEIQQSLNFDKNAAEIYKNLKSNKIRIGSMDLKIASIAIANKAILVSRNLKDFEQVPDLTVQDWTR